ncbi:hypothetical protein FBEOM_7683 [Fusarium beomiforme]|uniref:Alcohol acetyltransferase n=1 Tax=Fusarium beomiforme TaxID=44412 RepID=A0A9P5DXG8_9HYPO|nr:hypothetical protein FBEOM_7683 [Fusarium beomiforme]
MIARLRSKKSTKSLKDDGKDNDKDKVLRKLSPVERLHCAMHFLGIYVGCAISCRYHIPELLLTSDAESLQRIVENAFARAILEYPLFTVGRVNADSKKPSWVQLDQIDFNKHIEWQTVPEPDKYETTLHDVLDRQINEPYTNLETQPSWRAVILKPADSNFIDVVFAWDHTQGDGKSGKMFLESLFTHLNAPGDSKVILRDRSFEVPNTEITPPLHHLIKFDLSLNFIVGEVARDIIPKKSKPHMPTWAPVSAESSRTRQLITEVAKQPLKRVLDACRQHGTTLTGLMHALISVSMATRLPEIKARAFLCATPVCLRQFQKPGHPSIDMHKTAINSVAYCPFEFDEEAIAEIRQHISNVDAKPEGNSNLEATVWSAAKAIREGLTAKLDQGAKNNHAGLAKFVKDWRSYLKDHGKTREYSWEISNLGVVQGQGNDDNTEKWTIGSAIFTQTAPTNGPAFTFSVISVKGGGLVVTNSWQIGTVEEDLALGVSSDVESWLNELGSTGCINFGAREMSS